MCLGYEADEGRYVVLFPPKPSCNARQCLPIYMCVCVQFRVVLQWRSEGGRWILFLFSMGLHYCLHWSSHCWLWLLLVMVALIFVRMQVHGNLKRHVTRTMATVNMTVREAINAGLDEEMERFVKAIIRRSWGLPPRPEVQASFQQDFLTS